MNLLKKIYNILLRPEVFYEPDDYEVIVLYPNTPCLGTLEVDDWCKGCRFEKEHTNNEN